MMMKRFIYLGVLSVVLCMAEMPVHAQSKAASVPYICGFEAEDDMSVWELNPHANIAPGADAWMVGSYTHSAGYNSLYISSDGTTPVYGTKKNIRIAYLRVKFPETGKQQNYNMSFDWKGGGDDNTHLRILACPEQFLTDISKRGNGYYIDDIVSDTKGVLAKSIADKTLSMTTDGKNVLPYLAGSQEWKNVYLKDEIKVSSGNAKLVFAIVFIWINDNASAQTGNAICIDNLMVGSATEAKPKNLAVQSNCDDSTIVISWESASKEFSVEWAKEGTATWRRADGLLDGYPDYTHQANNCSYTVHLRNDIEGSYNVRVRGVNGKDTSMYTVKNSALVYCPYNHCINYFDIDPSVNPTVTCTYGHREGASSYNETPYSNLGIIDFGPASEDSRHTLHTDPTELDPRTDTMLHTVPKGAIGAVRLGNWKSSYEAESMSFDLHVDATMSILIVKYAIVLQKPGEGCGDPEFKMEILDEQGTPLSTDDLCGIPNFTYKKAANDPTWHRTKKEDVVWKDWTTVGVSLQQYIGQNLKVRFTSIDCGAGGHYGYGYFTLDCASANIETENCGADANIVCNAPEGFSYEWRDETGKIISSEKKLDVDAGMHTYTCKVSFIDDPDCYFEVSTVSAPRFPVPSYICDTIYENCEVKLKFHSTSHVMNKYEGFEKHTTESTNENYWVITRKSDGKVTESHNWDYVYNCYLEGEYPPENGDTIIVACTTYLGIENACDSTVYDTIPILNFMPRDSVIRYTTCANEPFYFNGEWRNIDSTYVAITPNFAGCDSVATLYLTVYDLPEDTQLKDSICSDDFYRVGPYSYNTTGIHTSFLKDVHGCDSIVVLDLLVNQRIKASLDGYEGPDVPYMACADDEDMVLYYEIEEGKYDSITLTFDDLGHKAGLRDVLISDDLTREVVIPYDVTVVPGYYDAVLSMHQFCCGVKTFPVRIGIRYVSAIVQQKWNDVLAILNAQYNGGYTFIGYQWYKDGLPIVGETNPYLYQSLNTSSEYYVELTRSDGMRITSCPMTPEVHVDTYSHPSLVQSAQRVPVYLTQPAQLRIYSTTGQLCSIQNMHQGNDAFTAPSAQGVYIVEIIENGGNSNSQRLIVY